MSSPRARVYTVAEQAAMKEAADLAVEQSRLRVALADREALAAECAAVATVYDVPLEVRPVPSATSQTSTAVRGQVDRLIADTDAVRAEVVQVRADGQRARLLERLRALPELVIPDEVRSEEVRSDTTGRPATRAEATSRVVAEAAESALHRATRYLDALTPGAELSDRFVALVAELPTVTGTAAELTARALGEEVGRANAEFRRSGRVRELLDDLDARAGALSDASVSSAVRSARQDADSLTDAQWTELEKSVAAAEASEVTRRNQRYVSEKMPEILAGLGLEIVGGFETLVPEGGLLVRRPGWNAHGVLFGLEGDEFSLDVVRTAPEADASLSVARDEDVEKEFCEVLPGVLDGMGAEGIRFDPPDILPPGVVAIEPIYAAGTAPVVSTTVATAASAPQRRKKPQERAR